MRKFVFFCDCKNYESLASVLRFFDQPEDEIDYIVDLLHSHDQVTRNGLRMRMIGRDGGLFKKIKVYA